MVEVRCSEGLAIHTDPELCAVAHALYPGAGRNSTV